MTVFQRALLGALLASALVLALVLAARAGGPPAVTTTVLSDPNGGIARGLVTTGQAGVKARPDLVELGLGVTTQGDTAADAQAAAAERIARVLDRAKQLGIPERDTKTATYRIDPQYVSEQGKAPRIASYQAQETIVVLLRDVNAVGTALDTFIRDDGATTATVRFTLLDPKAPQAEARALAILDARSKAEAMARTAGLKLGRAVAIADAVAPPQAPVDRTTFSQLVKAPTGTQVPVSELDVNVTVQIQFETAPAD